MPPQPVRQRARDDRPDDEGDRLDRHLQRQRVFRVQPGGQPDVVAEDVEVEGGDGEVAEEHHRPRAERPRVVPRAETGQRRPELDAQRHPFRGLRAGEPLAAEQRQQHGRRQEHHAEQRVGEQRRMDLGAGHRARQRAHRHPEAADGGGQPAPVLRHLVGHHGDEDVQPDVDRALHEEPADQQAGDRGHPAEQDEGGEGGHAAVQDPGGAAAPAPARTVGQGAHDRRHAHRRDRADAGHQAERREFAHRVGRLDLGGKQDLQGGADGRVAGDVEQEHRAQERAERARAGTGGAPAVSAVSAGGDGHAYSMRGGRSSPRSSRRRASSTRRAQESGSASGDPAHSWNAMRRAAKAVEASSRAWKQ